MIKKKGGKWKLYDKDGKTELASGNLATVMRADYSNKDNSKKVAGTWIGSPDDDNESATKPSRVSGVY